MSLPTVDLGALSTALDDCVSLSLGAIDEGVLQTLRDEDFDQAPVRDDSGRYIGVIARSAAESLVEERRDLAITDVRIFRSVLPMVAPLYDVLGALSESLGALVGHDKPEGLVTVSDLNRHEFRAVIYTVLADLEVVLAQLIDVSFGDHWDWIGELPKNRQAQIIGAWDVAKRRGIDIGPQAGATLNDLLGATRRSPRLREQIIQDADNLTKRFDGLRDLRNRVMHPVQAVAGSPEEVASARAVIEDARNLIRLSEVALSRGGYRRRLRWH